MKIRVKTRFLDGRDIFEQGDERTVSDERGAYFVANGWAEDTANQVTTGAATSGDATLDIRNTVMGQEAQNG